ncbi:N-acetylneuraminate synthase [Metabacillus halosaccharovorans]|uniref:N-acetylneuraminate synthase n=1 Tax=Metabacillus halosaccharovorans TaxID=930124 RepID=UPI003734ECF9
MFKIGDKTITKHTPTYIIAEIGVNHNGSMELAKKTIDAATAAGADAVKFQTFKTEKLVSKKAKQAEYQIKNTGRVESQFEMLKKLELTENDFRELKQYCEKKGIEFLSTPFDEESAVLLKELGVHAYKIGSGDLTNIPFLSFLNTLNIPIILSTGMATISEIEEAVDALSDTDVSILHCTSVYPAPYNEVNLLAIQTIDRAFGKVVGYSDHTLGSAISLGAVMLGAKIIEKHFTLDQNLPGPDHKASLNPEELTEFITSVRNLESSLGDGIKKCTPSEESTKEVARKSIVTTVPLYEGEVITEEKIAVKRPGTGIAPKHYSILLGKKVKRAVDQDEALTWDDLL